MIKARGGTILWAGRVEEIAFRVPGEDEWDFISLVHYPTRAAFLDMMTSEEYLQQANPHRVNAAVKHLILAARESYSKLGR
jgi:uncharacterized protein (DUF1330 family)